MDAQEPERTPFNWRFVMKLILLAFAIICVEALFMSAQAIEDNSSSNTSYIITEEQVYRANPVYRIAQGQNVFVNDTIDISGNGWGTGMAWYGKYTQYSDPQYILYFNNYRSGLQNFWLDPSVFADREGLWFQYYGTNQSTETNGNLELFKVLNQYANTAYTFPNGTTVYEPIAQPDNTVNLTVKLKAPAPQILPEQHVSDYLVAHGDAVTTPYTKLWVFGRVDGIYDHSGNLTEKEIMGLEIGSYKIISHDVGRNTIQEVSYDSISDELVSPWRNVEPIDVYGIQPRLVMDRFVSMIRNTDDKIETYNLEVQDPSITIYSISEVGIGNDMITTYDRGTTMLDVRGYTNVANGTLLTFVMDTDMQNARSLPEYTYHTTAIRTSPGNMSFYQAYIPINKNLMPNGIHTIKASTSLGGVSFYDFVISETPPDSYVPNATLKYIADRNPWVPTPTPVYNTVTVEVTREIVREVVKEVPPSDEQVRAQQDKIITEKIIAGLSLLLCVIGGFFLIRYLVRVWRRVKGE